MINESSVCFSYSFALPNICDEDSLNSLVFKSDCLIASSNLNVPSELTWAVYSGNSKETSTWDWLAKL